jgi:hypothetical protein
MTERASCVLFEQSEVGLSRLSQPVISKVSKSSNCGCTDAHGMIRNRPLNPRQTGYRTRLLRERSKCARPPVSDALPGSGIE